MAPPGRQTTDAEDGRQARDVMAFGQGFGRVRGTLSVIPSAGHRMVGVACHAHYGAGGTWSAVTRLRVWKGMDVTALLDTVEALPTARRVPPVDRLDRIVVVAGIEVAHAAVDEEAALRRAWRERHRGGATPLLLLSTASGNRTARALGPSDASGPLRTLDVAALESLLVRIAGLPRLRAVRELAAELDRLDQAGIPGVKVAGLLTRHTLDVRLRGDASRWSALQAASGAVPATAGWQRSLTALGYDLERRPQRGWIARHDGRPVAVVHPKPDPSDFARLDAEGRPPEGLLLNDCAREGAAYGLLTSGARLRLFNADPVQGAAATQWLDIDVTALRPEDRALLGLLAPASLAEAGLRALQRDAQAFGTALRKRLDEGIRQRVLPTLGVALGRWARAQGRDLTDDAVRAELEGAALALVFRALFVLYAEAARYLPVDREMYRHHCLSDLVREAAAADRLDPRATSLWDRFVALVRAMRTGNTRWGVPAYNGALFAADGFLGAEVLERLELTDDVFAPVLAGVGVDPESGGGVDYSTLEIGHLGHIYEGLLALRLSVADSPMRYDQRADAYLPAAVDEQPDVDVDDLLWQTHKGGRKGGGVYYTPEPLVRHLVRQTVVPSFDAHLERVRAQAVRDPVAAAATLFDFAVLDPACGSAHFLVVVVAELADRLVRFLADGPLPAVRAALKRLLGGAAAGVPVDDVALLRRLVLKRCIYGVDVSPMGAEVAKLSLWLAAFVPGLSLAYLDRNVQVGNALVGVADPASMRLPGQRAYDQSFYFEPLQQAISVAAEAATRAAEGDDRNPDEYAASHAAGQEARAATANLDRLFDLWTAEPFGLEGARTHADTHGAALLTGGQDELAEQAAAIADERRFLHWVTAFPQVFGRRPAGFDAVVGNPPWDEVTVEAASFWALLRPGIRRGVSQAVRDAAIAELVAERPELPERLAAEQARARQHRAYYAAAEYERGGGDPDLYRFFCQRYRSLLRDGGALGVVLPRTAFVNQGSEAFRAWLFTQTTCERVDFLLNRGRWAFDAEPRYTVAAVAARRDPPAGDHAVVVAGTADSLAAWNAQVDGRGVAFPPRTFGTDWRPPLLGTQAQAHLLAKIRVGSRFPCGSSGRWRCFPVAELNETNDKALWDGAIAGDPLWKGESFDQFDPHGDGERPLPDTPERQSAVTKARPGMKSLLAAELPVGERKRAQRAEIGRARVVFTDVTQRDNSRTVVACLVPPGVFLVNSAPYLAFARGDDRDRGACLGVLNSLPFDWQARRYAEVHMNFFILEGLVVPDLDDADYAAVAEASARLSCVDDRFADFAAATGVPCGPLTADARERLRVEIDARVARAWGLDDDDLQLLLGDFTANAVPRAYRERLRQRLREL